MAMLQARHNLLPGLGLSLGCTILGLSLVVLLPLSAVVLHSAGAGWEVFWRAATAPRVLASYRLTFAASLAAAAINMASGLLVAWVLVRYRFPGRRLVDALID